MSPSTFEESRWCSSDLPANRCQCSRISICPCETVRSSAFSAGPAQGNRLCCASPQDSLSRRTVSCSIGASLLPDLLRVLRLCSKHLLSSLGLQFLKTLKLVSTRSGYRALRRGGAQSPQSILLALTGSSLRIRASFPGACV